MNKILSALLISGLSQAAGATELLGQVTMLCRDKANPELAVTVYRDVKESDSKNVFVTSPLGLLKNKRGDGTELLCTNNGPEC